MSPFAEAQQRAHEIAAAHYAGMFVSMSWGGEYTDSVDVEAQVPADGLMKEIQTRLKVLGYDPGPVDGVIGPKTLAAILAALAKL